MSCKNCKFAKWYYTEKGNIKRSLPGRCEYVAIKPKFPETVKNHHNFKWAWPLPKTAIWTDSGKNCEVFENKND